MTQFMHWLAMGGYSSYIWSAYGLVVVVLAMNTVGLRLQRTRARKLLQQWFKRQSS
ncbi:MULTISPECIES: heme exporter protein CcmD [unclassified Legionella]|uniref:heme exporter protein CcmD n=1 Tax=unclassified Legionella TaxID=2622702 RepID=UPI001E5D1AF3|nr:heme exporter protein CcmD [Legionella sp. 31fI33]MCC5015462.1 heme exporter protein CcmD [Legionella sp. 31fI33]